MKLIKKILFSALALVCTVTAFASCGNQPDNGGNNGGNTNVVTSIDKALDKIGDAVVEKANIEMMLMPIDNTSEYFFLESYTGLTDESKVKEVLVYESAFGAQAFSLVFARVPEGGDAIAVAKEMDSKIDRRKWVCVGADDDRVAVCGDIACFVMADKEYGFDLDKVISVFKAECGAELSYQK